MSDPMSTREIARVLGISHGTVHNIIHRALAKLAAAMGLPPPHVPKGRYVARGVRRCGLCRGAGHQRVTCPERAR